MENKVLKTSNFEKIVNSLEGENIKRGIITRITKDADIIVTLNEELEGVGRETYLVVIPAVIGAVIGIGLGLLLCFLQQQ